MGYPIGGRQILNGLHSVYELISTTKAKKKSRAQGTDHPSRAPLL
jgi:hypothetical protein